MVASRIVTSAIVGTATAGSVRHVLLLGPDDDARRALHVMLDRIGKQVSAVAELDAARAYLGNGHECDAVIAAGELAAELVRGGAPPGVAGGRPRGLTAALPPLEAGGAAGVTRAAGGGGRGGGARAARRAGAGDRAAPRRGGPAPHRRDRAAGAGRRRLCDAAAARDDRARREHAVDRADPRRERHRQGAG